ncbi:procathepsin L-like [Haliotis asinina]|uniref:procathepsin L-like n=1 Tax=Haliotis asinina TaxID=109174 RepID=UPI003531F64C
MKIACVVLLLALASSSLGAPRDNMLRRLEEWTVKYEKGYGFQGDQVGRRQDSQDEEKAYNNNIQPRRQLSNRSSHSRTVDILLDHDVSQTRPKTFDWRSKGVISPVTNIDAFSNSFAIVARGCVASFQAIKTGFLLGLSAWEIVDCCPSLEDGVFDCIHDIGGLCGATTYPLYTGQCKNNSCQAAAKVRGGKVVPAGNVNRMEQALLKRPLAALMDASNASFGRYQSGIYNDTDCSKTVINHAMQVVGYGEKDGQEFWICKNTWGPKWGEDGYVRMKKGSDICGIESHVSYPY